MQVIPAINCPDLNCVKERIKKAVEFLPPPTGGRSWVQLDVADGKFTGNLTWNNPKELQLLITNYKLLNFEIHLMVENPETVIKEWLSAGAKRVIIHIEALHEKQIELEEYKEGEIGIATVPQTSVEELFFHLNHFKFVQILAVDPGISGQKFQEPVLEKIKFLKLNYPNVIIEVDGGINLETGKLCKEAGADILAAASYIWENDSPKSAFEKLSNI